MWGNNVPAEVEPAATHTVEDHGPVHDGLAGGAVRDRNAPHSRTEADEDGGQDRHLAGAESIDGPTGGCERYEERLW